MAMILEVPPVDDLKASVRTLEHRTGKLERDLQDLANSTREMAGDLRVLTTEVSNTTQSVRTMTDALKQIVLTEAKRGDPISVKSFLGTMATGAGTIAALGAFVWWVIASSPIVMDLSNRLSKIDDPAMGRVAALERVVPENKKIVMDLEHRLSRLDDKEIGRVARIEKELEWSTRVVRTAK